MARGRKMTPAGRQRIFKRIDRQVELLSHYLGAFRSSERVPIARWKVFQIAVGELIRQVPPSTKAHLPPKKWQQATIRQYPVETPLEGCI